MLRDDEGPLDRAMKYLDGLDDDSAFGQRIPEVVCVLLLALGPWLIGVGTVVYLAMRSIL